MSKLPKVTMADDQKKKCHAIIHAAAVSAGGAGTGLAQIPLADSTIITPIQIGMIIALGKVFDQKITEAAAKAVISGMAASFAGRTASQLLVGWIPVVGNAINTATAAGLTELVGWTAAEQFYQKQLSCMGTGNSSESNSSIADQPIETSDAKAENSKADQLKKRANEFFSGNKTVEDNNAEYKALLNDIEAELDTGSNELYDIYDKLLAKKFPNKGTTSNNDMERKSCRTNTSAASHKTTSADVSEYQTKKPHRADAICELKIYDVFTLEDAGKFRVTAKVNYAPIHVGDTCALIVDDKPSDQKITILQIGMGDRQWTEKEPDKVTTLIVCSDFEYASALTNQRFICVK